MSPVGAFDPESRHGVIGARQGHTWLTWAATVEDLHAAVSPDQLGKLMVAADLVGRRDTVQEIASTLVEQGVAAAYGARGVVVLLDDDGTHLQVVASSGYDPDVVVRWRRFPLCADAPLSDAVRTGRPVMVASVEEFTRRYPCTELFDDHPHALLAVPLFSASDVIGGWSIRLDTGTPYDHSQVAPAISAGRYLGNFASSGIARAADRGLLEERVHQLQTALTSRIMIEQAKGVLAERHGVTTDNAFRALRRHARVTGQRLHAAAAAVVAGELDPLA